jgi:hypothetical protein
VDGARGGGLDRPPRGARDGGAAARLGLPAPARLLASGPPAAAHPSGGCGGPGRLPKNLGHLVEEGRAREPGRAVEVWAVDEHRAGLRPVLRRVWAKEGRRPVAPARPRYEWLYLYGFVHPGSGAVEWFLCNTVNLAPFAAVLARFAQAVGAGPDKLVILVLDGAGWHAPEHLAVPEGLRLVFLPPYTPELQPAEHLWPLVREAIANEGFASRAALDRALADRCLALAGQPDPVKANTRFHWWPKAA